MASTVRSQRLPLYLTLTAFAVSANAVPPLLSTLSARLALPPWTLGVGITIQFIAFSAVSWLGGILSARRGIPGRVLILSGLLVLAAALVLAPFVITSLTAILAWMCVLGLAGGSVETFASIGMAENSSLASSKPLCLSQAFFALGAFAAPRAASVFLERPDGWRSAFFAFSALAAAVTLFFAAFGRSRSRSAVPGAATIPGDGRTEAPGPRAGSAVHFRLLLFAYVLVETLCGYWLPYMLESQRAFSVQDAAATASMFWFGMIAGRLAIAFLPDRLTLRPALAASSMLAVAAALALLLFPAASGLLLFALGLVMGPIWPIAVRMASARLRSDALTASVVAAGGLGGAVGSFLGSLLLAWGVARSYFQLIAVLCAMVAVVVMIVARPREEST